MNELIFYIVSLPLIISGPFSLNGLMFLFIALITYMYPNIYCRQYSIKLFVWGLIFLGAGYLTAFDDRGAPITEHMLEITLIGNISLLYILAKKRELYEKYYLVFWGCIGFPMLVATAIVPYHNINEIGNSNRILNAFDFTNTFIEGIALIILALWLYNKYYTRKMHNRKYEGCNCPYCSKENSNQV